ncbi:hypothetical protein [Saccharicrinis fermentans]|uniref:hypothetical protein n=2 Tax=Saccharicrinis fermentans TaxID=982 RepID=UPI00048619A6|nr:hypothetical protein [Saccharicrinis fermentans]
MKRFLNIIYYFLWRFMAFVGGGSDKFIYFILSPFKWLALKIPIVRKRLIRLYGSVENAEKEGMKAMDYFNNDKEIGYNTQFANGLYVSSSGCYFLGIYLVVAHYFKGLLVFFNSYDLAVMLGFGGIAAIITHFVTFEKKAYKKYFKEFDKIKGWQRFVYKLVTFVFVIGAFIFGGWAMVFANH